MIKYLFVEKTNYKIFYLENRSFLNKLFVNLITINLYFTDYSNLNINYDQICYSNWLSQPYTYLFGYGVTQENFEIYKR